MFPVVCVPVPVLLQSSKPTPQHSTQHKYSPLPTHDATNLPSDNESDNNDNNNDADTHKHKAHNLPNQMNLPRLSKAMFIVSLTLAVLSTVGNVWVGLQSKIVVETQSVGVGGVGVVGFREQHVAATKDNLLPEDTYFPPAFAHGEGADSKLFRTLQKPISFFMLSPSTGPNWDSFFFLISGEMTNGHEPITSVFALVLFDKCRENANTIVIDVGANSGWFTLTAASFGCRVHSFEAQPDMARFVDASVRLNAFQTHVTLRNAPVSDVDGMHAEVRASGGGGGHAHIVHAGTQDLSDPENTAAEKEKIKNADEMVTVSLDAYIARKGITEIEMMKIDVEGHEIHVLQGAIKTLSSGIVKHLQIEIGEGPNNQQRWERTGSTPEQALELLKTLSQTYEMRFIMSHGADLVSKKWRKVRCAGFLPENAPPGTIKTNDFAYAIVPPSDLQFLLDKILSSLDINLWLRKLDKQNESSECA